MKILEYFFKNHNFDFSFSFQLRKKHETIQVKLGLYKKLFFILMNIYSIKIMILKL